MKPFTSCLTTSPLILCLLACLIVHCLTFENQIPPSSQFVNMFLTYQDTETMTSEREGWKFPAGFKLVRRQALKTLNRFWWNTDGAGLLSTTSIKSTLAENFKLSLALQYPLPHTQKTLIRFSIQWSYMLKETQEPESSLENSIHQEGVKVSLESTGFPPITFFTLKNEILPQEEILARVHRTEKIIEIGNEYLINGRLVFKSILDESSDAEILLGEVRLEFIQEHHATEWMHNENFASPVLTISTVLHNKVPWWLGPTMQIVRIHPDQLCLLSVDPSDSIAQSFSALPGLYLLRLFWGHIRFIWKDFQEIVVEVDGFNVIEFVVNDTTVEYPSILRNQYYSQIGLSIIDAVVQIPEPTSPIDKELNRHSVKIYTKSHQGIASIFIGKVSLRLIINPEEDIPIEELGEFIPIPEEEKSGTDVSSHGASVSHSYGEQPQSDSKVSFDEAMGYSYRKQGVITGHYHQQVQQQEQEQRKEQPSERDRTGQSRTFDPVNVGSQFLHYNDYLNHGPELKASKLLLTKKNQLQYEEKEEENVQKGDQKEAGYQEEGDVGTWRFHMGFDPTKTVGTNVAEPEPPISMYRPHFKHFSSQSRKMN